jgi:hypothetical protein
LSSFCSDNQRQARAAPGPMPLTSVGAPLSWARPPWRAVPAAAVLGQDHLNDLRRAAAAQGDQLVVGQLHPPSPLPATGPLLFRLASRGSSPCRRPGSVVPGSVAGRAFEYQ